MRGLLPILLLLLLNAACKVPDDAYVTVTVTTAPAADSRPTRQVLVANRQIPVGKRLDATFVTPTQVPTDYAQPDVISSVDEVSGLETIAPIRNREQVLRTKFADPVLARSIPKGLRAYPLPVRSDSTVSEMHRGDHVDVYAVFRERNKETREYEDRVELILDDILVLSSVDRTGKLTVGVPPNVIPTLIEQQEKAKRLYVVLRQRPTQAEAEVP